MRTRLRFRHLIVIFNVLYFYISFVDELFMFTVVRFKIELLSIQIAFLDAQNYLLRLFDEYMMKRQNKRKRIAKRIKINFRRIKCAFMRNIIVLNLSFKFRMTSFFMQCIVRTQLVRSQHMKFRLWTNFKKKSKKDQQKESWQKESKYFGMHI